MRTVACVAMSVLFLAAEATGQSCGPFLVSTAPTGGGCAPFGGGGGIAALTGGLGPSPPVACNIVFTVTASSILFVQSAPTLLWLGVGNPALNLAPLGFPGCTLLTSGEVLLPVLPVGLPPVNSITVPVAPNPVFVGATVFAQALALPTGLAGGVQPTLSNGIRVSL